MTLPTDNAARRQVLVGHANTFHDPAIAIAEGNRIYAEAFERHTQCKRAMEVNRLWYSRRPLTAALEHIGIWPVRNADVTVLMPWDYNHLPGNGAGQTPSCFCQEDPNTEPMSAILSSILILEPLFLNQLAWLLTGYPTRLEPAPPDGVPGLVPATGNAMSCKRMRHHLAHAANAVYTSPFEECIVIVIDGYGEDTSMALYHFADNAFRPLHDFDATSLGLLYANITDLCGFSSWEGEEWKLMGLAAYGQVDPDVYEWFKRYLVLEGLDLRINLTLEVLLTELAPLVGGFRQPGDGRDVMEMANLACTFQKWFEDTLISILRETSRLGLSKNLAYAGGCALNSSANGKILANTDFEALHIPCAPADDGNALGTLLYEKHCIRGEPRIAEARSPYLGSPVDIAKLERILGFKGIPCRTVGDEAELCSEVAGLIADGKIIGWMQGRAEFGPRALGNRSILADPRPADMKDRLNARVKFREAYRPVAPSILHEFGNDYFENYQESPYMERTLPFRSEVRDKVAGAVHADGTGRLQSVREDWNPRYARLIRAFHEKTGVPILLNTSFNVMGKPIIHSVEDAITAFYTTGMDALVIDKTLILKPEGP